MKRSLVPGAAAILLGVASLAHAGGPLVIGCGQAFKYPDAGTVTLNYDVGALGSRSKAQADALVTQAAALWTNVSTASITIGRGPDLATDITAANYTSVYSDVNATGDDGLNPVIYDTDGSITDAILGANQKEHVLAFASSPLVPFRCTFKEGQAVINGSMSVSDTTLVTAIAHELGHLIGLDHTQLDSAQGLSSSNYPLMYPIPARTVASLHEDDVAAVSALYPDVTLNAVYSQVAGTLTSGGTAVLGANIWANEIHTGKVYSIVSDYLKGGTGAFRLLLPTGSYQLHVEAIDTAFTGKLRVGHYSNDLTGASFQPPLYTMANGEGSPMAPVTMGNGSPLTFRVSPGCILNAALHLDGTVDGMGTCRGSGGAPPDFGGDGKSDLLYRNFATGQVYRLFMDGFSITSAALAYTEPNLNWHIVADADFNGDGVSDLIWRNDATGQFYMQFWNASGMPTSGAFFWTEPNPAWKIVATPDFDGDGMADLLWWNSTTGQVYAMKMIGAAVSSTFNNSFYTEPNTQWQIVASGDFAGTGLRNQVVWRNATTGQVYLMTVRISPFGGFSIQAGQMIYQEPNTAWKIIAAADFNADGKTDLLWRNDVTGEVYVFLMNGPAITAIGAVYAEANLDWKIVSVGDYNGDGKADILYRNFSTGQVNLLQMDGLAITNQGFVYQEPNLDWHVLGRYEYAQ